MKKYLLLLVACSFALIANAQTIFETYLKKVPALPRDSCNISYANADNFALQVNVLIDELDNEIETRNRLVDKYSEDNEEQMKNNITKQMQQQYGMSDEDIDKMKNGDELSDEETQALANKMMMQQTNISMAEIENISNMSEAGKKAWAEGYAAEAMANAQSEPTKQTGNDQAKTLMALSQEQQSLVNKINVAGTKIANQYSAIESDPSEKTMTDNIARWNRTLVSMMGEVSDHEAKIMDSLSLLIQKEQIKYCDKFTPKYRAALRQDLANVKALLPDYRRLDEVTGEILKVQTGVDPAPESKDRSSLQALLAYLKNLEDAYKYKLYYPEEN
jgi:hypothetical protein